MWFVIPFLITIHVIVCLLLVLVVLMQLPRSEGLGAAFGGAVTDNIFGAQATNVLARFTVYLGIAFFIITLLLAIAYGHKDRGTSSIQRTLMSAPVPTASASPAPAAAATPVAVPSATEAAAPATTPAAAAAPAPAASVAPTVPAASPVGTP